MLICVCVCVCVFPASIYSGMCVVCVYANVNVLARYVGTSLARSQFTTKQAETSTKYNYKVPKAPAELLKIQS